MLEHRNNNFHDRAICDWQIKRLSDLIRCRRAKYLFYKHYKAKSLQAFVAIISCYLLFFVLQPRFSTEIECT